MDEQDVAVEELLGEQDSNEGASDAANLHSFPVHWQVRRLSDLGEVYGGSTPSTKVPEYWDGDLPWLTPSEVTKCEGIFISDTERHITSSGLANCAARLLPIGTVMMTSRATIGEAVINTVPMATNQGFINLVCSGEQAYNEFLVCWIRQNKHVFESRAHGVTFKEINRANFKSIPIALPPLPEQQAIAHSLRTMQEAIQTRRREADLERERKAALMQHLFTYGLQGSAGVTKETPFGQIPEHWHIMLLESCAFVQTGITKGRDLAGHNTVTRPYLRVANVQDGYLDLSEMKEIEVLTSEEDRYLLQLGDVVMTEGGDFDKLGRGFIWQGQVPNCVHQNHIFAVRVNRDLLLPQFFAYLIQSSYGKAYFLSVAHRTTNLASINSTKLKALSTLLPPLTEQQEIVAVLDACDTKLAALEQETRLLEELFRALLEELMTGQLSTIPLVAVEVTHE